MRVSTPPDLADAPRALREFANVVGLAVATDIIRHYDGQQLYVPHRIAPEHPLMGLVKAPDLVAQLERELGGARFDVSGLQYLRRVERDAKIIAQLNTGRAASAIAKTFGISARYVRKIRQRRDLSGTSSSVKR